MFCIFLCMAMHAIQLYVLVNMYVLKLVARTNDPGQAFGVEKKFVNLYTKSWCLIGPKYHCMILNIKKGNLPNGKTKA